LGSIAEPECREGRPAWILKGESMTQIFEDGVGGLFAGPSEVTIIVVKKV
jgi:hypothetical protein